MLKAESQQSGALINGGSQNNVKLQPERLYPTSGSSISKTLNIATSGTVFLNGSMNANEWRCIKTDGNVSVSRDQTGLSVNGTMEQYTYQLSSNSCTGTIVAAYRFNNLSLDDNLQITAGSLEIFDGTTAAGTVSATFDGAELLAESKLQTLGELFGPAWADLQTPFIIDAINIAPSFLHLDRSSGEVSFDFNALQGYSGSSLPVDFNSLNKAKILAGTVFGGAPGGNAASTDWCRIVNIPNSGSDTDQQYQVVISTNCARSTARWCDAFVGGDGKVVFQEGTQAAAPPVAWDDAVAASAMKNTAEQKRRNQQGHFITDNMAQNAFVLAAAQAIVPVFGYTSARNDGKTNNSGASSWTGHMGHCQNVMSPGHKKVGVAWLMDDTKHLPSYWTQNFLD